MIREFTYHITEQDIQKAPSGALTIQGFLKSLGYSHSVIVSLKRTPQGIVKTESGQEPEMYFTRRTLFKSVLRRRSPPPTLSPSLCLFLLFTKMLICLSSTNRPECRSILHRETMTTRWQMQPLTTINRKRSLLSTGASTVWTVIQRAFLFWQNILTAPPFYPKWWQTEDIHREYLAVVKGKTELSGVVEAPIGRKEGSTIERQVDFEHGDYARTIYRRLYCEGGYSLLSLSLDTGRTHQIRVHMNYIGHPLPGDFLYCPDYTKIRRQALHSYRLSFLHPITKEALSFTAPLPDDMRAFFTLQNIPPINSSKGNLRGCYLNRFPENNPEISKVS